MMKSMLRGRMLWDLGSAVFPPPSLGTIAHWPPLEERHPLRCYSWLMPTHPMWSDESFSCRSSELQLLCYLNVPHGCWMNQHPLYFSTHTFYKAVGEPLSMQQLLLRSSKQKSPTFSIHLHHPAWLAVCNLRAYLWVVASWVSGD